MKSISVMIVSMLAVLALSGCKIVRTGGDANPAAAGEVGDDARITGLLDKTYATQLLPLIQSKVVEVRSFRTSLTTGLDAAGAAYGYRAISDGAAWNFAVKGMGRVLADNPQARARRVQLDTDGDGQADLALQLGPVIKGTSLRDIAPFYRFGDFRDQIEFARLGRALNDRALAGLSLSSNELVGRDVVFVGTVALRSVDDEVLVTPVVVEVQP